MSRNLRKCTICGKSEYGTYKKKLFYTTFPLEEIRCREWVRLAGDPELVFLPIEKLHTKKFVCGDHFEKKMFNKKGNRLKRKAVPKLNLRSAPLTDEQLKEFPMHMWNFDKGHSSKQSEHSSKLCEPDVPPLTKQIKSDQSTGHSSKQSEHSSKGLCEPDAPLLTKQIKSDQSTGHSSKQSEHSSKGLCEPDAPLLTKQIKSDQSTGHSSKQSEHSSKGLCEPDAPPPTKKFKSKRSTGVLSNKSNLCDPPKQSADDPKAVSTPIKQKNEGSSGALNKEGRTSSNETDARKTEKENILDLTPRKKKLIKQLQRTKGTLKSLRKSATLIEKIESPVLRDFVLAAAKNQNRNKHGRRWTTQNKISCLAILKRSAKTYRYLRYLLPLPSVKTLQNVMKKLPMQTGLNKSVIDYLKKTGQQKDEKEKVCALLFDEIALKPRLLYNATTDEIDGYQDLGVTEDGCGRYNEVADHALVLMLQGIYKKFKQPIAMYFVKNTISSEKLAVIIKDTISAVDATGYRVLTTVCDQGPTNMGAIKLLKEFSGPGGSENSFKVNGKEIYVIYDVPHLFKSIRNNFLKYGNISFGGRVGKWEDLLKVEEKNRKTLYLSKITPTHVQPKYKAKMKVSFAAQVLSNTVAAVLKLMAEKEESRNFAEFNQLMSTAETVQDLDRLFDISNGPSGPDDVKINIRQNVSQKSNHLEQWAEFEKKMETMTFFNNQGVAARNIKCVQGYITTLKSLRQIWTEVRSLGFKFLNLRQLNQDSLENLFGLIRQHSPTNKNPTCSHFIAALKTAIITNLTAPHSRGSNCQKDKSTLLTSFHDLLFNAQEANTNLDEEISQEPQNFNLEEESCFPDAPVLNLQNQFDDLEEALAQDPDDAVVYVSGYLAYRIVNKVNCNDCANCLINHNPEADPLYSYIRLREWWSEKASLTYPSKMLCHLVEQATLVMEKQIFPILFYPNIGQLSVTLFLANCETEWFKCTEHKQTVLQSMFLLLAQLLIRRQCQRINLTFASQEESLADAVKRAQQYGQAK